MSPSRHTLHPIVTKLWLRAQCSLGERVEDAIAALVDAAGRGRAVLGGAQLHLSERTLRRRLEAEGLSLRELTDQVRHELSLSLPANQEASTDEVAAQLGFTTAQAFHRAFRRWTGETVQGYRSRQRG